MSEVVCRGLTKRFGDVGAVLDVELALPSGEILGLLGPSGCGKTTLLRLIAGFERPDHGEVRLGGRVVAGPRAFVPAEQRRVGIVFQDYALFPHLTVAQNVAFGADDRRAAAALALVGLSSHAERYPHELSGGQQQRTALARALAPAPAVILMDEPFSNLDADLRARVRGEVRAILQAARATVLFVTHDQEEALEISDRAAVMREGRIEQVGTPEEIYHVPATRAVADFVGRATFLPTEVMDGVVRTELGAFDVGEAVPAGAHEIMVRPEDLVLSPDERAAPEVVARRFQGPVTMCDVRLPSGRTIAAAHASQVQFRVGERVAVSFRPDHLVLFDGERRTAVVRTRERTGTDAT